MHTYESANYSAAAAYGLNQQSLQKSTRKSGHNDFAVAQCRFDFDFDMCEISSCFFRGFSRNQSRVVDRKFVLLSKAVIHTLTIVSYR